VYIYLLPFIVVDVNHYKFNNNSLKSKNHDLRPSFPGVAIDEVEDDDYGFRLGGCLCFDPVNEFF